MKSNQDNFISASLFSSRISLSLNRFIICDFINSSLEFSSSSLTLSNSVLASLPTDPISFLASFTVRSLTFAISASIFFFSLSSFSLCCIAFSISNNSETDFSTSAESFVTSPSRFFWLVAFSGRNSDSTDAIVSLMSF